MNFTGRSILLDIEGTTSSIEFVFDVLFEFARRELEPFLSAEFSSPEVREACEQIARDTGATSFGAWLAEDPDVSPAARVAAHVHGLMDQDVKSTGLKTLQGLIWRKGYAAGELRSHVYEDVPAALGAWKQHGLEIRIYSSGSVGAQKLFFAHSEAGDLSEFISGNYDTRTGSKRDPASYDAIAEDMDTPPGQVLFLSDVVAELDAARKAGMRTALVLRESAAAPLDNPHPTITSFDEIRLA